MPVHEETCYLRQIDSVMNRVKALLVCFPTSGLSSIYNNEELPCYLRAENMTRNILVNRKWGCRNFIWQHTILVELTHEIETPIFSMVGLNRHSILRLLQINSGHKVILVQNVLDFMNVLHFEML